MKIRAQLSNGTQGGRSLDAQKIEAAYVGFHKTFNDRLGKVESIHRRIATVVETTDIVDRQVWVTGLPKMRKWIGDKVLAKLRAESHPITTAPYEASLEVPLHDIRNDKLGLWAPKIAKMADAYEYALDELAIAMLVAGVSGSALGTTYDGQNLLDTDHTASSVGGVSQSNRITGALTSATFNEARHAFMQVRDERGRLVNPAGTRLQLVVGPDNEEAAREILQADIINNSRNLDRAAADLIVTNYLSAGTIEVDEDTTVTVTGTEWFLMPADSSAILLHVKRTPDLLSVEDGEFPFRTGKVLYGVEAEFGAAYGLWQEIAGGPGA